MSKTKFVNVSVEIDDPQERFKENEEITVHQTYDSQAGVFRITVPEIKETVSEKPKEKPIRVFTGKRTKITGTITVKGEAMLHMKMMPDKVKDVGRETIKQELDAAFDAVMEKV